VLDSSSQLFFSCSDRLSHITTVGPSSFPQKSRSPRPADWKKGGADIAASPSILVALLICCSARNTAYVGCLYSACSNSSVRFVSFRIVVIRPSQHSCFFRKFHPPLVIDHPRPGSRHVVRPSVVIILVSSTRLPIPATSLEFWQNYLLESLGPGTNSFLSLVAFLAHEGGQGHVQILASRALPTACFYAWTPNLSCQLGFWQRVDEVLSFVPRTRTHFSIHCVVALVSVQDHCCSTLDFHPK